MSNYGNDIGVLDREIAAKILIGQPRSSKRGDVGPELVDYIMIRI